MKSHLDNWLKSKQKEVILGTFNHITIPMSLGRDFGEELF